MEFFLGVLASLVASVVFFYFTNIIPFSVIFLRPSIIGCWKGDSESVETGVKVEEEIVVENQFLYWCKGKFFWNNPDNKDEKVEYNFKGKFTSQNTVIGEVWPASKTHIDYGVFLIALDPDTKAGIGGTVSIDFKEKIPMTAKYKIYREV